MAIFKCLHELHKKTHPTHMPYRNLYTRSLARTHVRLGENKE